MSLGLGTAALGRPQYINVKQSKENSTQSLEDFRQKGIAVLEKAYHLGIRYFDTAPGYGLAENLLLDWLQTKNNKNIQIATKWGYTYVANFKTNAKVHEIKEQHSLQKLNEQWQTSKAFLPHLKVYQIHSTTLETGVLENEEILNHLHALKEEHQISIGITTTGANQAEVIKKALDVSINGKQLFDAFQITYNVLDQNLVHIAKELITYKKQVIIKEALANARVFRNKNYHHYNKLYAALERLAIKYNVQVDAIALKFCQQTIQDSIVLSGASNDLHMESNFKMNDFKISEDEIIVLRSLKIAPQKYWDERKQLGWN